MSESHPFSITERNSFHFRDRDLELELSHHPLSGRVTVTFNGEIVSDERITLPGFGYDFNFDGHAYTLIQARSEDRSCTTYYQLSCDGEVIERYEIVPTRKFAPAIGLVAFCVVIAFPVAAGELSEAWMGISVLDWSIGVKLATSVAAALSAIGLCAVAFHRGVFGQLNIKNLMGPDL